MTERLTERTIDDAPRPFYFMVPFWGRRYREYFVDTCLPSLLAPNNLPLLRATDGHRFLIATTKSDWAAIENLPILTKLREFAPPVLIEVADPGSVTSPGGMAAIRYQNLCQKKLVEAAHEKRAYGCLLSPDIIISDGMIASLLRHAEDGCHLVLCPALRQAEEGVMADLLEGGFVLREGRPSENGRAIAIPPRIVGDLLVRHLHPEILSFEEDNPQQPFLPPFRFWRVPDGRGIIMHTFFALPVLMDYAAVKSHDSECLEQDAFENVYLGKNFSSWARVHVVADSDEFGILSVTPAFENSERAAAISSQDSHGRNELAQICSLRESMGFYARRTRDVIRRNLFRVPICWHAGDLDGNWTACERQISVTMDRAVGDFPTTASDYFPRVTADPIRLLAEIHFAYLFSPAIVRLPLSTFWLVVKALAGNRGAGDHLRRRIIKFNAAIRERLGR